MKNKIGTTLLAVIAIIVCSCKTTKNVSTIIPTPSSKVESVLEFSADTIYVGTYSNTVKQDIANIYVKCVGDADIHITEVTISDPTIVIATSPVITPGTYGNILSILTMDRLSVGSHADTINIRTDSSTKPNMSIVMTYDITEPNEEESVVELNQ